MTAPLNLLTDAWIPVCRSDGRTDAIRPAQLVEQTLDQTAIAWPRADFRLAQLEFLIGLLATLCPPSDEEAWQEWWEAPPEAATLDAAFAPFARAFELDGTGPRFLQDAEELVADPERIEKMLMDSPGDAALKKNSDLLVKRGRAEKFARATAAIALYTQQSWAQQGGAGILVGIRGGGPLLTLVLPNGRTSLWHAVWANVPVGAPAAPADIPKLFAWCAPTRTSDNGRVTTPSDTHPHHVFWGMPRRIRLDFVAADGLATCDLTGALDTTLVTGWRQRPRGPKYSGWGGMHPLTPHYAVKGSAEVLPLHGRDDGVGYRDWVGLVLRARDESRRPAACVETWFNKRAEEVGEPRARLLAAGYAMDVAKAVTFVESDLPLLVPADSTRREALAALARALIEATEIAAGAIRRAVRDALFAPGATVKPDAELLSLARETVWQATEAEFYRALEEFIAAPALGTEATDPRRIDWLALLRRISIDTFDRLAPISEAAGRDPQRIATARKFLLGAFAGFGKDGAALIAALGLPVPEAVTKAKARPKREAKARTTRKGDAA